MIQIDYMYAAYYVFTCLFIGVCTFFLTFATDLNESFVDFNGNVTKTLTDEKVKATNKKFRATGHRIELKKAMHNILRFHADVKQLRGNLINFKTFSFQFPSRPFPI